VKIIVLGATVTLLAVVGGAAAILRADAGGGAPTPLKEAKLNIEHNATEGDTGFQGAIDSEGWQNLQVRGPDGTMLSLEGKGELGKLGLTELFFETVEPANADVPIEEILKTLPEGNYEISGNSVEDGERAGRTTGTAWLTHDIPAGPELLYPRHGESVPLTRLVMSWASVTQTITGDAVNIIAYQLIIEKDTPPDPNMIGKVGSLSVYLPPSVTSIRVPDGFLEAGSTYDWEVLAIEESGNQTLSSSTFQTQ